MMGWDGSGVLRGYMPKFGGNASLRSSVFFFLFFSPSYMDQAYVCFSLPYQPTTSLWTRSIQDQAHEVGPVATCWLQVGHGKIGLSF
jgi:hypothetical protein